MYCILLSMPSVMKSIIRKSNKPFERYDRSNIVLPIFRFSLLSFCCFFLFNPETSNNIQISLLQIHFYQLPYKYTKYPNMCPNSMIWSTEISIAISSDPMIFCCPQSYQSTCNILSILGKQIHKFLSCLPISYSTYHNVMMILYNNDSY